MENVPKKENAFGNKAWKRSCIPISAVARYAFQCWIDEGAFVYGRGHHKNREQRYYKELKGYTEKLKECGENLFTSFFHSPQ